MREPLIHSHITDCLPDNHPLAYKAVNCKVCGEILHASNNECMQTWIETGQGAFCVNHSPLREVLEESDALPDD